MSQNVFQKLKKMLKLGLHPDTPELEAQAALRLAKKQLLKYNLTQEDVLGKRNDTKAVGGMVPVILRNIKTKKRQKIPRWVDKMAQAVSNLYGVSVFFRRGSGKIIFYGVLINSRLAAYAFSVAYHYIHVNMRRYMPSDDDYSTTQSTTTARNCYADGIAEELKKMSKKEAADIAQEGGRALILLNNQKEIALDVLRNNGLNLRKGRSHRERAGFARNAFLQGKADAVNIDLRRRALL